MVGKSPGVERQSPCGRGFGGAKKNRFRGGSNAIRQGVKRFDFSDFVSPSLFFFRGFVVLPLKEQWISFSHIERATRNYGVFQLNGFSRVSTKLSCLLWGKPEVFENLRICWDVDQLLAAGCNYGLNGNRHLCSLHSVDFVVVISVSHPLFRQYRT